MKKILGLDLGTNSIGWAVVNADNVIRENETSFLKPVSISASGSRIIPMDEGVLGDFDKGNTKSQTKDRTDKRGTRRLLERNLLRRERLLRVLKLMDFLPEHYAEKIDSYGKFIDDSEPKLAWRKGLDGKFEFIFKDSFNEMLDDFAKNQQQLVADGKKVPYDWTIYFLRKKALSQRLTKEELAWILLQFNQKRGYYQLRGEEEEENVDKLVEFLAQKVVRVEATDEKKGDDVWYNVYLENGMVYRRSSRIPLDWEGKIKEFIVTTDLEKDGTPKKDKEGNIKHSFRAPKEDDWTLLKKKTEFDIDSSKKTIGCYIYDALLTNPDQKIIGKLVRTVERKYYKEELKQILAVQKDLIPELQDENLYKVCIEELYPNNEAHRNNIAKPDFANLFINDILFYQRPLKSKKSLISDCPYESHFDKDGNEYPIKCIAKSNPLFQEFRLWQFVHNLRIYQRERTISDGQDRSGNVSSGKLQTDVDVTDESLKTEDDYVALFDWLNDRATIKQDTLLNSYFKFKKEKGKDHYPYRWNYVEDKEYPCNETRAEILKGLDKCRVTANFLTKEQEMSLWHILYSVEDKIEIGKALKKYAEKNNLSELFAEVFAKIKPFKKDYGSYSEKAIKKLLPLMRMGKYWNADAIDAKTKERIDKIITGEYDEKIKDRVREKTINLTDISQFKGLPLWLASYVVYDRHSEAKEITKWESPDDIDTYLKNFKQHSLRNPIVEQVVTETLRTVRDIWKQEGNIDEIHIELGREMKNPADKRKKMTERIQQNENTNLRIKAMLMEFMNPEMGIENVRPYSPSQQDILRIYEENALDNLTKDDKEFDFISKVSKQAQPSKSDIIRYKCWLEQKYRSPYTGEMIPLAKLFTSAYEIEHVIPQSRYFDDSFSNKVICEAEVNKLKDRQLGFEFIKAHKGEKVQISQGKTVEILSIEAYEKFVKDNYANNRTKMKKLLMDDIPDGFIERQLNDSRYISKLIKNLLSNIVREKLPNGEYEQEAVSKNLISCNGSITDRLKKDWGMNDVWNSIILPRFKRLNELTKMDCFTAISPEGHEFPAMPLELKKGFNKKRIDHRHHAMDAIVIACTTRDHVNLLNNEAAHSKKYDKSYRYDLQSKLRRKDEEGHYKEFLKPWDSFITDAKQALDNIIVSFKQNLRVINKTTNYYQHYDENGKKIRVKQVKGDNWAIRKSMHKDTGWGEINLQFTKEASLNEALKNPKSIVNKDFKLKVQEFLVQGHDAKYIKKYVEDNKIDIKKIKVYYFTKDTNERYFATRFLSDLVGYMSGIKDYDKAIAKIEGITDTGIQKILKAHLQAKDNNPELAFSADGIDEMNHNIVDLNGGKPHKPIYKVRRYESGNKYSIGQKGCKVKKFVEADKGTNLFFAVYTIDKLDKKTGNVEKVRTFATVPLNIVIDCQKKYQKEWKMELDKVLKEKEFVANDAVLKFILSPNDLVYVPTSDELRNGINADKIDKSRVYKFVDSSGIQANFVPSNISKTIFSIKKDDQKKMFGCYKYNIQNEIGVGSRPGKSQNAISGEMIKEICIPIKVDRLGNVIEFNGIKS
jgi:CRISPR-associated endonuclease Csn1